MTRWNIGVIVGSLRRGAYSRALAHALVEVAPQSLALSIIEIGNLPLYNQDLETDTPPPAWSEFRQAVKASAGILFVTPEYNRSMPGALKNALDAGSRPWGQNAWDGKPAAIISITPGALGAMASNHHLRQVVYAANMRAMAYPEAYVAAAAKLFDERGQLVSKETRDFLTGFMQAFQEWVEQLSRRA